MQTVNVANIVQKNIKIKSHKYCTAINKIEELEHDKNFRDFIVLHKEHLTALVKNVKIIGDHPLIKVILKLKPSLALWDTESMIPLISKYCFSQNKVHAKSRSICDFIRVVYNLRVLEQVLVQKSIQEK